MAALNDCVYRTMYRYRYALLVDVDEYIVPQQHEDYGEMMEKLTSKPSTNGSFLFNVSLAKPVKFGNVAANMDNVGKCKIIQVG